MDFYLNAWGGEGYLSSAALTVLGLMGMLDSIPGKIHVRVLDFAEDSPDDRRRKRLAAAYLKYYQTVFGKEPGFVYETVSITDLVKYKGTVLEKFRSAPLLSLGCSVQDMNLDIRKGLYGKPWLGEVYHADADFKKLYENIPHGTEVMIINCGGYRGGGTATTFIPLETLYAPPGLVTKRFTVVTGPAARFMHLVSMPHPEIYFPEYQEKISIFELADVIMDLYDRIVSPEHQQKHNQNLASLEEQYHTLWPEGKEYANLNPKYYAARFLDRIYSDCTPVSAVFLHIKTDGEKILPYDVSSDRFEPDTQSHKLHITNLLNALSVREICLHGDQYSGGNVYAFGTSAGDKYTCFTLFPKECAASFWRFVLFAVILNYYMHDCFVLVSSPHALPVTKKWAKMKNYSSLFSRSEPQAVMNAAEPEGVFNLSFAKKMLQSLNACVLDMICPVLSCLTEIDEISSQADLFPDKTGHIIREILISAIEENIKHSSSNRPFLEDTAEKLISVLEESGFLPADTVRVRAAGFMQSYLADLPLPAQTFSLSEQHAETAADLYADQIFGYTMQKISELL